MRLLGIFRNGHRSEEYWRSVALTMAQDGSEVPFNTRDVLDRAEEYLKFLRTGKALPPL